MQYSLTFCSQPEAASDVIFSVATDWVGMDVLVDSGDSRTNQSRVIRAAHFVTNDDERKPLEVVARSVNWRFA